MTWCGEKVKGHTIETAWKIGQNIRNLGEGVLLGVENELIFWTGGIFETIRGC